MASSSASSVQKSYHYDVFLNFRGEDTRKNFVDHLYHALQHKNIHTYKDDETLKKGKNIDDELLRSIEESRFCIMVFSKDYASSSWCLDELVKIMECQKTTGLIAYPVFYDVDPSQVFEQSGAVGEAFAKHSKEDTEVGKWREALKEASNLAGWDVRKTADGHEAKVIKLTVEAILLESRNIDWSVDEDLIGMEPRMQVIESSLEIGFDDVRMIGIKGIGGGGKTTLARALFDKMYIWFKGASFVANVREASKASGLHSLQKQVLSDVLNDKGISVSSVHDGNNMMKKNLGGKKVLLVLDDVDHISQLEALAGAPYRLKPGSRIIITTRDEQVLVSHRAKWIHDVNLLRIHDVNLLSDDEAILLFSRYAFGTDIPIQGYEKLSREAVRYADGLPLTIKVLGSFLCGKDELEWIDALERLKTIPLKETLEQLELSYTGLEDDYKEIFLDVACFFKGYTKADAIRMLESCEFHARNGLRVLEQKSLITISDGRLGMHDHLQEMGRNIVRRLHPDEPSKHSRLWIPEEIQDILTNDLGTEATRAIMLPISREQCPEIFARGFGNMKIMKKLRFLYVHQFSVLDQFDDQFEKYPVTFPDKLQYLFWAYYPQRSLPKTFEANNLVSLELRSSRIVHLWEGGERKVLNKLRFLDLSDSSIRILDLGGFPNLEKLNLKRCDDFVELQAPVGCLKRLVFLSLSDCIRLKSFSFIKQLESLEVLRLDGLDLEKFPDIIPGHSNNSLVELWFGSKKIKELPSSIVHLQKLVCLVLECYLRKSFPRSILGLRNLRTLKVFDCVVEELPEDIDHLECLEELCFSSRNIKHLPNSICKLKHLKTLDLSFCDKLENLPGDLGQLECLEHLLIISCSLVRDIPDSVYKLKRLKLLDVSYCDGLGKLPEELGLLECLRVLNVENTRIKLPKSISLLKDLKIHYPNTTWGLPFENAI